MTSNQERAAEILADWADSEGGLTAIDNDYGGDMTGAAEALADAGLLMPNFPEPSEEMIWYSPRDDHNKPFEVWVSSHGTVEVAGLSSPRITLPLDRAHRLAFSTLAAANHAEQEKAND